MSHFLGMLQICCAYFLKPYHACAIWVRYCQSCVHSCGTSGDWSDLEGASGWPLLVPAETCRTTCKGPSRPLLLLQLSLAVAVEQQCRSQGPVAPDLVAESRHLGAKFVKAADLLLLCSCIHFLKLLKQLVSFIDVHGVGHTPATIACSG